MKVKSILSLLAAFVMLFSLISAEAGEEHPFPPATPESQGLDPAMLMELSRIVQGFFEEGSIAGAELLIVKNRKTVLHEAIGWKDAEDEVPMERNTLFNIRSMTKPITGTLAQILIDEKLLDLEAPASKYLDFFGQEKSAKIMVKHLITHRSGLPLTAINLALTEYADLEAVAEQAAGAGPEFPPGAGFQYSDAGSDSLGAILEKAGRASLGALFEKRIFGPLMMKDTYALYDPKDPRAARTSSNHTGSKGAWSRYWKPEDEPFYPFTMGSQSVYCTPMDYARFLAMWMDQGRVGAKQVLSKEAVARGLKDVSIMNYPTRYKGLEVYYGQMWMLYLKQDARGWYELEAIGHGGSDGTYAVAFPNLDLMVFYFTQSRGQHTIMTFERAVEALLINPDPEEAKALTARIAPEAMLPYLGLYRAEGHDLYRAVLIQDGKLTVEVPGQQILPLEPAEEKDTFRLTYVPDQKVVFVRSKSGEVTGIDSSGPMANEFLARIEPEKGLPTLDEIMTRFLVAHGSANLSKLGTFRFSGTINMEARKITGKMTDLYQGRTKRCMTTTLAGLGERRISFNNAAAWSIAPMQETTQLTGIQAEQVRLGSLGSMFSDWREEYREVQVLYRLKAFSEETYVIRTVPHLGYGSTKYIGVESGRFLGEDRISLLPGAGPMGAFVTFDDFRDVEGMLIPFKWTSKSVHPLIGTIIVEYDKVETGLELGDEAFDIK